jgi:hypothetical protein
MPQGLRNVRGKHECRPAPRRFTPVEPSRMGTGRIRAGAHTATPLARTIKKACHPERAQFAREGPQPQRLASPQKTCHPDRSGPVFSCARFSARRATQRRDRGKISTLPKFATLRHSYSYSLSRVPTCRLCMWALGFPSECGGSPPLAQTKPNHQTILSHNPTRRPQAGCMVAPASLPALGFSCQSCAFLLSSCESLPPPKKPAPAKKPAASKKHVILSARSSRAKDLGPSVLPPNPPRTSVSSAVIPTFFPVSCTGIAELGMHQTLSPLNYESSSVINPKSMRI